MHKTKQNKDLLKKIAVAILIIAAMIGISYAVASLVHKNGSVQTSTNVKNGLSAYELAVQQGYTGSLDEWLISLEGKSAYQIAVDNGYSGSEKDWSKTLSAMSKKDKSDISTASFTKNGDLVIVLSDGTKINVGKAVGAKGEDGKDGVGITAAKINEKGELIITYSDGRSVNLDRVVGETVNNGVGVASSVINESGELVLTYTNGEVANLGKIIGTNGTDGKDGVDGANGVGVASAVINDSGELVLSYTDGATANLGKIVGSDGIDGTNGADGRGIKSLTLSPDGELVVVMSDNSISNLGNIKGEKGDKGLQGERGADGRGIAKTELVNGELVITYTDGTSDNLGSVSGAESGISDLLTYELLENDTYAVTGSIVSINKLTIPSSYNGKAVTEISEYAFKDEVSILSVTIPNTVVKICTGAFMYCTNLKTVRIPASVKEIERSAFTLNKSQFGDSKYSFSLYVEGENNWNGYASRQTSSTSFTPNSLVFTGELDGPQLAYSGTHRLDPNNNPYPYYSYGDVTYKRN